MKPSLVITIFFLILKLINCKYLFKPIDDLVFKIKNNQIKRTNEEYYEDQQESIIIKKPRLRDQNVYNNICKFIISLSLYRKINLSYFR
jgi:hypothetical protein